jgi:hypothetical protein
MLKHYSIKTKNLSTGFLEAYFKKLTYIDCGYLCHRKKELCSYPLVGRIASPVAAPAFAYQT